VCFLIKDFTVLVEWELKCKILQTTNASAPLVFFLGGGEAQSIRNHTEDSPFGAGIIFLILVHPVYKM